MSNISIKLNLLNLRAVKRYEKGQSGPVECLIIPIENNHLFVGEKGVYIDLIAFELRDKKEGSKDTHLVKQQLPKEIFEKMTDEQKKSTPILGNCTVWDRNESESQNSTETLPEGTDLPFN